MEGEFILMGIVMLIGQVILMGMWNANWFKRENFKIQKTTLLAQNKLQLRKLERDLGLTKAKDIIPADKPSTMQTISNLAPLLSKLNPDTIDMLADKFLGNSAAEIGAGGGGDVTDMLMNFATKNPEMVQDILGGITEGYKGGGSVGDSTSGFIAQG